MKLKKIDLSKSVETSGGGSTHPDINLRKWYLAKINEGSGSRYAAGKFNKQWYGLNFDGFWDAGLQFDAPGCNSSPWLALWEMTDK